MPGLAYLERLLNTYPLVNGQDLSVDLPRDFAYVGLKLRLSGSVVISGGTTNGVVQDLNPWTYLRRIMLEGTGGDEAILIKNLKGYHAARLSHLFRGIEPPRVNVTSGAAATYPISADLPIWFTLPGSMVPVEIARGTFLNPARYSKLTLTITPLDATAFIVGGDRTVTVTNPTLDVVALQALNVNILKSKPLRYRETFFLRDATSALATERRPSNPLPTGNRYRGIMVVTLDETSNKQTPVDDTIGAVKLQVGPTVVRRYTTPKQINARLAEENGLVAAQSLTGITAPFTSENPVVGFYLMDFMVNGRLEGLLDTRNLPGIGVTVDLLHDILTASARQVEFVSCEIVG